MGKLDALGMFIPRNLLCGSPDIPTLEISRSVLKATALNFIHHFPGETSYAVKANSSEVVLQELVKSGIATFDVASIPEMDAIRQINPAARLHYHNPAHSKQEIELAYFQYGCRRFAVDHLDELFKIHAIVPNPSEIEIAVRFCTQNNSKAVMAFKSKFGALKTQAAELLVQARQLGFITGLTFHPGSQTTSPAPYKEHVMEAAQIARLSNQQLSFLNIGGGFPSRYNGLEISPLDHYFHEIKRAAYEAFGKFVPMLECEPGRAMVAAAGTLETRIKTVRRDKREVFLNDGIYGGLMEVYQFPALRPEHEVKQMNSTLAAMTEWTIFGPTCDPIDMLPFKLTMPETIEEGDIVRFLGVGAYSNATATRFNGYGNVEIKLTP